MLQNVQFLGGPDLGGGVVTFPNFFSLKPNQSPNSMNVKFGIGGTIEKRLGTSTTNATALASTAGWGMFDFGASDIRWLVVAAASGIFVSSNRGVAFLTMTTGTQTQNYQFFERSKSLLIATGEAQDPVLYWAGSVATFAARLAPGSAPQVKYALDFQGFLLLMNSTTRRRGIYYADNNLITTSDWSNSFDLPSSFDDEITGATILNKKAYIFTRYKVFRLSYVGGNPDFGYQDVKDWGAVPGTIKKVVVPEIGEVIIVLSWDKTLRLFDGSEDQIISDSFFRNNSLSPVSFSDINTDTINRSRAETDTNEQVYKLLLAMGTSTQPTHAICYNYRIGAFYPYSNYRFTGLAMAVSGNSRVLMGVQSDGRVHIMDSGNRDITTAVDEYYDSPFFYNQNPRAVSKTQNVSMYFTPTSSGTLYYQDRTNYTTTFGPPRDTISFASTAGIFQIPKTISVPMTQNLYQYRLSSSANAAAPWKLNRVDMEFGQMGVGKAG